MPSEDILELVPPAADRRIAYGSDPNQFGDLRLPKPAVPSGKLFPVVMNIHGGFWRARYDLVHAGHLCAALTQNGLATWNIEYRRVGNEGGGWPGTFEDVARAYRFLPQIAGTYKLDAGSVVVMGHSAGGQLALCLAAHEPTVQRVVSLAGVIDLVRAFELHLSSDAVVAFLGGKPGEVADHYREADPMQLSIVKARQILIHGLDDDTVPPDFSQRYREAKKRRGEAVSLAQIPKAGHYEMIDPRSAAWKDVEESVRQLLNC